MLNRDELPEDNADLAKFNVSCERLSPDTSESCPVPMSEILDYLALESPEFRGRYRAIDR